MDLDTSVHGLTELRVHGVSGTPPSAMLDHPESLVKRVAGTSVAGFHRRWYPGGATVDQPEVRHLEAYGWGGLTSGSATRALWMLLLPFTLVNVAHWMLPPHRNSRLGGLGVTLLRLLGLTLTLTTMLAVAEMTMDLAAWQCAPLPGCARRMGPFSGIASWSSGQRVAVGALPPALLIILLWHLGRSKMNPALDRDTSHPTPPPAPSVAIGRVPLAEPNFWNGDLSTRRLRAAHVTAWASALALLALLGPAAGATGVANTVAYLLIGLNGALLAAAVLLTASNPATGRGGVAATRLDRPAHFLRLLSLVVLAVSLIATALISLPTRPTDLEIFSPTHLPGMHAYISTLLVAQTLLLLAFTCCVAAQRPWLVGERPGYRVAAGGFAAPLMAVLSWLVAGALSVGLGLWLARFLGDPVVSESAARTELARIVGLTERGTTQVARMDAFSAPIPLVVPPIYFWAAAAAVLVLGTILIAAIFVFWRLRLRPKVDVQRLIDEHHDDANHADETAQTQSIASWVIGRRRIARLTDYVDRILAAIALTAVLVMVVAAVPYSRNFVAAKQPNLIPGLAVPGILLIASAAAAVVALAFWAFRDPAIRRYVGIIWDLATFWPRANHPLTPPCYGEQAVPDLLARVRALTTNETDVVVLSGHSQGSVIAAAVMLALDSTTASRTGLLTYGSPLRRLYGRFFPAYFGAAALDRVNEVAEPCWRNLWVPSDPIGGWQFAPGAGGRVDVPLADPVSLVNGPNGSNPVLVLHSGYFTRNELTDRTNEIAACRRPH